MNKIIKLKRFAYIVLLSNKNLIWPYKSKSFIINLNINLRSKNHRMNHEISATPSTRRLNILSGHLLVPNAATAKAAAPAKTFTPRAPKGNFKDCKILNSFN
jgi:hypothetical protein